MKSQFYEYCTVYCASLSYEYCHALTISYESPCFEPHPLRLYEIVWTVSRMGTLS